MPKKRKIYLLQATTTPYRTELFNLIEEESQKMDIDFNIIYYKKMMANRDWIVDEDIMTHKYKIYDCFEYFIKGYPFYFSLNILKDIKQNPDAEVILGVSWNDFIVVMIVFLSKLGILKNKLHFWSEANYMDYMEGNIKSKNNIKDIIRRFIFNTSNGKFIIPGKVAEVTVKDYWKIDKEIVYLANTVDIDFQSIKAKKFSTHKIHILIVARLEEKIKGLLNFINNISELDLQKCEIYILGDGSDRLLYEDFIKKNDLKNIHLVGNMERNILMTYYKGCDLFILPSFFDSNPLSVIEALFAKKPILISNQCGNKYEAVKEGLNGYLMNPYEPNDIKEKFNRILNKYNKFEAMGKESFKIAKQNFEPRKTVKSFLENL